MKYLKMLGLAAVAAMSFTAFAAGSASATTLEIGGQTKNEPITIFASLEKESSITLSRTDGSFANTCTESHVHGETTPPYTGTYVTGHITTLFFGKCERATTVHVPGKLEIHHITGTTNGTVYSEEAEVTTGSPFGTLNCKTGATTHIGTLTGVKEGHATMDIHAVLNCGFLVPSARWTGAYTVTTPTGLGVSA